ncbi:MAG: DUF362 domain-containing protein [Desulfobacterales bacterium]|nr:DUF362 domain-containing protein [Desulfobacterales bacterium]
MRYPPYLEDDIVLPDFYKVRAKYPSTKIEYISKLKKELTAVYRNIKIKKNDKVAVCVGSRGISDLPEIVKTVCTFISDKGGVPFIVPAMGSHGGATTDGQVEVLEKLGVSEDTCGVQIKSSLDVDKIGKVFGEVPVYFSKDCMDADHSICINRIKSHTKFKGKIESGLLKMICVGMGKHLGAMTYHNMALKYGFQELLIKMGRSAVEKSNIRFGVAIVENSYDEIMEIKAIEASDIFESEKDLLKIAKRNLPNLPVNDLDALIIDQIGKEISGAGMDPNVTGRTFDYMEDDFSKELNAKRVAVLNLTDKTGGNAIGVGNADIITEKVFEKMNYEATLMNALTSMSLRKAFIPVKVRDDMMAIKTALLTTGPYNPNDAKVILIKDTKHLDCFIISSELKKEFSGTGFEIEKTRLVFDNENNLTNFQGGIKTSS